MGTFHLEKQTMGSGDEVQIAFIQPLVCFVDISVDVPCR